MSDRKYASDYRLEEYVTPSGKRDTRRIYEGAYYRFVLGAGEIRSLAIGLIAASCCIVAALLPMLFNNTRIGRTFYVLLPVAFVLVPLYLLFCVGFRLLRSPERMTRQERDLTQVRLKRTALWLTGILAISVAGCVAYICLKGLQPGEIWCIAGIGLGFLISLWVLRQRGKAEAVEVSDP